MPKDKPKSELALARVGKVGKISIVGVIGWDFWDDGISYSGFKRALADLGKVDILEVDITSDGGIVTDGLAIGNALREHEAPVHIYVNSMAASIASVIAMAGDRIFIPTNSRLMIHKPLIGLFGNADDLESAVDQLNSAETAMIADYMRHFKGTEAELRGLMSKETFLTAGEVANKFNNVTLIHSEEKLVACCDPIAILGDPAQHKETILDKAVNAVRKKVTGNDPKEVDMTPEETKAMEDNIVAKVVAALKPAEPQPEPKVEPAPVAKVEIEFVGDMTKAEDVQAHADKVALAELTASADMTTTAGVVAYQSALAKHQGKEALPASAQAQGHEKPKTQTGEWSDEDIQASIDRQCGKAK